MKKLFNVILSLCLLISCFVIPENISAKTLQDLYNELEQTKKEYEESKHEEQLTNQQIAEIKTNISNINSKMLQINKEIGDLNDEIQKLTVEIADKDREIKDIINFLQLSNGESAYLEYAFGAQDFTDFIYRVAITEQMTDYNDKLIAEYNQMIENNIKKGQELKAKETSLKEEQKNLQVQLAKLGNQLSSIFEISVDLKEAIRQQEDLIQTRVDMGCELHEDINNCGNRIPKDNTFWRPIVAGSISSQWGPRTYWLNGRWVSDYHNGIDVAASLGTPIYAAAKGVIGYIANRTSCGGTTVYIYHNVNNQNYTSQYMHMYQVYVNVGDVVTKDTVIGTVGGDPVVTWWDNCTTGAHLHFGLLYGHAGVDYGLWDSTFYARLINPATKVNFPKQYWNNRDTYYHNHY